MAWLQQEHGSELPCSSAGVLALAQRLAAWARRDPRLTLTREKRERDGPVEHGHGERELGGALARARLR